MSETSPINQQQEPGIKNWSLSVDLIDFDDDLSSEEQAAEDARKLRSEGALLAIGKDLEPSDARLLAYNSSRGTQSVEEAQTRAKKVIEMTNILGVEDSRKAWAAREIVEAVENPVIDDHAIELAHSWREIVLEGEGSAISPDSKIRLFTASLIDLSGARTSPKPEFEEETILGIFGENAQSISRLNKLTGLSDTMQDLLERELHAGMRSAMRWEDPRQVELTERLILAAMQEDERTARAFLDAKGGFSQNVALTDELVQGLTSNVLPRIRSLDHEVETLQRPGNKVGMFKDEFGISTLVMYELARKPSPVRIREYVNILYDIPTTDFQKFNQNRRDALQLIEPFGILRDFIHDQRPRVHDVIASMVAYYDDHDIQRISAVLDSVKGYLSSDATKQRLCDLERYDAVRPSRKLEGSEVAEEPVIEILRRLERNTRPVPDMPPRTSDETLNNLFVQLESGDKRAQRRGLQAVTAYMNTQLSQMYRSDEYGIEPSMVQAIAWVERQQFKALQSIDFEDQQGLAKQQWFVDVLRFHDLTHNDGYSEEEFDNFVATIQSMNDKDAARAVSARVVDQVKELADQYKRRGKDAWVGMLWSGNVTHELIGITDEREATTAVGRRIKKQRLQAGRAALDSLIGVS